MENRRWLQVESSNVGAVRYWPDKQHLDVMFRTPVDVCKFRSAGQHEWTMKCSKCRPKIFYRYKDVHIEAFVEMLFADSTGSFFNKEIKAASEEPEKLNLVWQED